MPSTADAQPKPLFPTAFPGFSPKQIREIEAIFRSADHSDPAEYIAGALHRFLQFRQFGSDCESPVLNSSPALKAQQKACAKKIESLATELSALLTRARARDFAIVDPYDYRSNIIGSLALTGWAKRKQDIGKVDEAELLAFLETGDYAFDSIQEGLVHLAKAANKWTSYYELDRGRRPSELHELICVLAGICQGLIAKGPAGEVPNSYKPSAPNSVLCRTLAIVLEVLEWKAPANLPQAVRRALEAEDKLLVQADAYAKEALGYDDHK